MKDLEHFKSLGQILSKTQQKKILGGYDNGCSSCTSWEVFACCADINTGLCTHTCMCVATSGFNCPTGQKLTSCTCV